MVAVITGASSGIGEAVARRLAREPGAELVLVARREDRLAALARELDAPTTTLAVDLTDANAPEQLARHVIERHAGQLNLLVNNAGAAWRASFAEGGYANVKRTMDLNFDAVVRTTEKLLPLLRGSSPAAVVNVSSTAGRISRPGSGAYSASKFALAGWTDALRAEEKAAGVHVGLVLPGFVETEGFPAAELTGKPHTRWMVSTPEKAAEAVVATGLHGKAERYVPRAYGLIGVTRLVAPGLVRRVLDGGAASVLTTKTGADAADASDSRSP